MKATVHANGPQGVSAWMFNVSGTSYPVQMYVAQTWNPEIAREQGRLFAEECRTSNVSAMYAPAVNLHRIPYSGRNFEYYSEDGFLSGKMAVNVVYAVRDDVCCKRCISNASNTTDSQLICGTSEMADERKVTNGRVDLYSSRRLLHSQSDS